MKHLLITAMLFLSVQIAGAKQSVQTIPVQITENGFEPSKIDVKPGTHVILKVTRKTDTTCATSIQVKEKKIKKELPLNKEVSIDLGTLQIGEIRYACGMDMITGHLIVK